MRRRGDMSRPTMLTVVACALVGCAPPRLPINPEVSQVVVPSPPELKVATAPGDDPGFPMTAGQTWKGTYLCGQGTTQLRLEIVRVQEHDVGAIFRFHHRPTGARGAYEMQGSYDLESRELLLTAGEWIEQPPGYVTVDMVGALEKRRYAGRILNESCGAFSLIRQRQR